MLRKCIIMLALGLILAAPATAREYFDGTMLVSPTVFVLDYQGSTVSIHTEVQCSDVARATLVLRGANGVTITPLYVSSDMRGNLVAKFSTDDFRKIVEKPRTDLTLMGAYVDFGTFFLNATIRVR